MLDIVHLSKTYGDGESAHCAVGDVSLGVAQGEFVSIVGPSGCGKTTLLKCMAGLLEPTRGQVLLHGQPVLEPPEATAVVFQDYGRSLMPWLSVRGNVELPLRHTALTSAEREERVTLSIDAVGLARFPDRYPWQLSGGMQQRVAIARALAYEPELLLMDEPFASVDAQTRGDLEDLMLRVRERYGMTIALVTHDIDESVYLADRVVVLSPAPSAVVEILGVELPHPRDQVATKELPGFARLRAHVYRLIREERAAVAA
jgi:NitT/TauT family transport system ATP-binding protein